MADSRSFGTAVLALALPILAATTVAAQLASRPVEEWVKTLDGPARVSALKIDEVVGALSRDIDDTAADGGDPPGVGRIDDVHGHTRITPHIAHLLSAVGSVHKDMLAISIDPDLRNLW